MRHGFFSAFQITEVYCEKQFQFFSQGTFRSNESDINSLYWIWLEALAFMSLMTVFNICRFSGSCKASCTRTLLKEITK